MDQSSAPGALVCTVEVEAIYGQYEGRLEIMIDLATINTQRQVVTSDFF